MEVNPHISMVSQSSPGGFSLADLLTRVLPGSVFIFPALISILILEPNLVTDPSILLVVIAILSFLFGELIDQFRKALFRVPAPFAFYLYHETDDMEKLGPIYGILISLDNSLPKQFPKFFDKRKEENRLVNRLPMDFRKRIENDYSLNFDSNSSRDIYDCIVIDMESEFSDRTFRQRTIYIFSQNLQISTVVAAFIYTSFLISYPSNNLVLFSTVILYVSIAIIFFLSAFMGASSAMYVELLMKEIYVNDVKE